MSAASLKASERSIALADNLGWRDVQNLYAIRCRMRHLYRSDVEEVRAVFRERGGRLFGSGIHKRLTDRGRTEYQARWIIYTASFAEGKR